MRAWDDEMRKAGVLLASEGLVPSWSSKGVVFSGRGRRPRVVDGPFAEAKEVVAGFTIIDVSSEDEAIEWATRCPVDLFLQPGQEFLGVEVRRIGEIPQEASEDEATAAVLESIAR
jgi:hypothetical protein